jgi:hypothetical protein
MFNLVKAMVLTIGWLFVKLWEVAGVFIIIIGLATPAILVTAFFGYKPWGGITALITIALLLLALVSAVVYGTWEKVYEPGTFGYKEKWAGWKWEEKSK